MTPIKEEIKTIREDLEELEEGSPEYIERMMRMTHIFLKLAKIKDDNKEQNSR